MNPNRAILLTGRGAAAIAVLRLAGPLVPAFLQSHFSAVASIGRPVHGDLRAGDHVLDDPVVLLHAAGAAADINLHGGTWVVQSVIDLARTAGFQVVPGNALPLDAAACDGSSTLETEVLQWLPAAQTEPALRAMLSQATAWSRAVEEGRDEQWIERTLADPSLHFILHPPRIAIIGPANVGKSTLANQLFAHERSITADLPGTTRDWVGEPANIDGLSVTLIDTPGLRCTTDPIEHAAIQASRTEVARADLIILVLDPTQPAEPEQSALLEAHPDAILVLNKVDRPAIWDHPFSDAIIRRAKCCGATALIRTIATTGRGIDDLRLEIRRQFSWETPPTDRPACWTDRQREILQGVLQGTRRLSEIL